MRNTTTRYIVIAAVMALASSGFADLQDAIDEADAALKEFAKADASAGTVGAATSPVAKQAEEALDKAEQLRDDARDTLDKVNNNTKSTPAQKAKAKKDLDKATKAAEAAEENADIMNVNTPGDSSDYRDKLEERRKVRNRLKKAREDLNRESRKVRGGFPSTEKMKRKAGTRKAKLNKVLGKKTIPPPSSSSQTSAMVAPPAGAAIALVAAAPDDYFVFNQPVFAVTTVGEIEEVEPGEKVAAGNAGMFISADGWNVVEPVIQSAATAGLSAYIGSSLVDETSGLPVIGDRTPMLSSYNPAGVEATSISTMPPGAGGIAEAGTKNYMETPFATLENTEGMQVGQVGSFRIETAGLSPDHLLRIETYDAEGNLTGSTPALEKGMYNGNIQLRLDPNPQAGQPGALDVSGISNAEQALKVSTVSSYDDEDAILMLEYQGGLKGPESVPLTSGSDSMTIPVQYPINPGEVGVSGRLQFGSQGQKSGTSQPAVNPGFDL